MVALHLSFKVCAALTAGVLVSGSAFAGAVVQGFHSSSLARNDDSYTLSPVDIGFNVNFFGSEYGQLYVNNNGNVTFRSAQSTFTPYDLNSTQNAIIAPFFADVDTRYAGDQVTYGTGTYDGQNAFGVNWVNVDYFLAASSHTARNSFQLILVDRGNGDFDIVYNYDTIQWETGTASGGSASGLGGFSARVGYSNGTGEVGSFFELPGSAVNGAFLDGGLNSLASHRMDSDVTGRYIFQVRGGGVLPPSPPVPEPETWAMLLAGLGIVGAAAKRRRRG
ncbi:MAG: PEPxxWA-CTERM sorting domain-containing protein [Azoarcus sp.]|jgi:hypothetical protein|nr:PEPxxWA-CTERM sorting domain-containing protein [Azoarcus sp.]